MRYPDGKKPRKPHLGDPGVFLNGGDRIRTCDLEVMSLASYRAAPPRVMWWLEMDGPISAVQSRTTCEYCSVDRPIVEGTPIHSTEFAAKTSQTGARKRTNRS